MSKARRKNTPAIPSSPVFEIPPYYSQTSAGERFLLTDAFTKRGKERILIFFSDKQFDLLFNSEVVFMDGTFKTSPNLFDQVFLMHVPKFGQGWL